MGIFYKPSKISANALAFGWIHWIYTQYDQVRLRSINCSRMVWYIFLLYNYCNECLCIRIISYEYVFAWERRQSHFVWKVKREKYKSPNDSLFIWARSSNNGTWTFWDYLFHHYYHQHQHHLYVRQKLVGKLPVVDTTVCVCLLWVLVWACT